ncbi:MAG: hypothetical protein ACLUD0_00135 [Eubacterium ramulus]
MRKAVKTEEILIDLITTTQEIGAGESSVDETALLDGWKRTASGTGVGRKYCRHFAYAE